MDHDTDGDGAINLSTSQRPSASTTPNGDLPAYGQDQRDNDQVLSRAQLNGIALHVFACFFTNSKKQYKKNQLSIQLILIEPKIKKKTISQPRIRILN